MPDRRPRFIHCATCDTKVKVGETGRVPTYCSNACRQAAFYKNTHTPLSADDRRRIEMWELLKDGGVVPADMPVPPKRSEVIAELKAELKDIAREARVVHKPKPI